MILHDCQQGSPEWLRLRKGKPTASRFGDVITAAKGDLSKAAAGYIDELIGELFFPDWVYFKGNAATERGTAMEPEAREAFADHTGLDVRQVGFVTRLDGIIGCSPDGLVMGENGVWTAGVELKCPSPKEHVGYVRAGALPDVYKQQVHGCMAVTGLSEWHFWSYLPGVQPFHLVVRRDDYTEKLSTSLDAFLHDYREAHASAMPKLRI